MSVTLTDRMENGKWTLLCKGREHWLVEYDETVQKATKQPLGGTVKEPLIS